jgi:hypothetical protein
MTCTDIEHSPTATNRAMEKELALFSRQAAERVAAEMERQSRQTEDVVR